MEFYNVEALEIVITGLLCEGINFSVKRLQDESVVSYDSYYWRLEIEEE